ncbi:MAG TPA: I78 family peptidase inhibitor [Sphingomonas sp.]|jgi:hypothetical protein
MWRLLPLVALAACTQTFRPDIPPAGPCAVSEEVRMRFVGQRYVSAMRDELGTDTRSAVVRVLRPDDVATMDVQANRLNVMVGEDGRIDGLRCG